jgi:hypothetical protein
MFMGWSLRFMMKQPAENANATAEEERATWARAVPLSRNSPSIREEVAKIAYQHWQERQGRGGGSPEEDWLRAETIVRNRLTARTKA